MYTEILRSIDGIGIFPVIALMLFAGVFGGVLIWAVRADKTQLAAQAALPLDSPQDVVTPRSPGDGRTA